MALNRWSDFGSGQASCLTRSPDYIFWLALNHIVTVNLGS